MSPDVDKVIVAASRLPVADRARVIERLLASIEGEPDADAAEAWAVEIARRSREIERGLVEPVPWSELQARVERRLRGDA